jgi:hypothetical protein
MNRIGVRRLVTTVAGAALVGGLGGAVIELALGGSGGSAVTAPALGASEAHAATSAARRSAHALRPETLYEMDAPGVVVITAMKTHRVPARFFHIPGDRLELQLARNGNTRTLTIRLRAVP